MEAVLERAIALTILAASMRKTGKMPVPHIESLLP